MADRPSYVYVTADVVGTVLGGRPGRITRLLASN
jgi:hypothetical protein